jgi:hypothetical protein
VATAQKQLAAALKQTETSATQLAAAHQQIAELEAAAATKEDEYEVPAHGAVTSEARLLGRALGCGSS